MLISFTILRFGENFCIIETVLSLHIEFTDSMINLGAVFTTSDLQFGFRSGYSTTLCTGVMKAYLNSGSCLLH